MHGLVQLAVHQLRAEPRDARADRGGSRLLSADGEGAPQLPAPRVVPKAGVRGRHVPSGVRVAAEQPGLAAAGSGILAARPAV
eukprot:15888234-Heterocapsa_arctica.AAC.1